MNCRETQNHFFADPDSPLDAGQRAAVEAHVANCGACKRVRESLEAALTSWRHSNASVSVPDAEREWHAVRRRIRGGAEAGEQANSSKSRRGLLPWLTIPLGAAAALALAVYVGPFDFASPDPVRPPPTQTVRVAPTTASSAASEASTLVFVDDKSGWLVVWANDAGSRQL